MGQKVNPHGMRVGVIKDWDSRWYARDEKVGDLIVEDYNIRKFLKKTLYGAGVPKIEIERSNDVVKRIMSTGCSAVICCLFHFSHLGLIGKGPAPYGVEPFSISYLNLRLSALK